MELIKYALSFCHGWSIIIGKSYVECLSALYYLRQRTHGLLKRSVRIHSVMVEYIHIRDAKSFKALVQTRYEILSAAPVAVRAFPHIESGLRADYQLIPVRTQILSEYLSKVLLRTSVHWTIVVCYIKMCYSVVKCGKTHLLHILVVVICSKVVPESKCQRRHHETALAAMSVKSCTLNILISICCCLIISHINTSLKNNILKNIHFPFMSKPGFTQKKPPHLQLHGH